MDSTDADWAEYYRRMSGRSPRPLAYQAVKHAQAPGIALDLGCGDGTETVMLLKHGWTVHAVDLEPAALNLTVERAGDDAALTTYAADLVTFEPPRADLMLACASLPFVPPDDFDDFWRRLRSALRPDGLLAVHLFGDQDSWAHCDSAVANMTFHSRPEVEQMLAGLETLQLEEHEFDGASGRGPKHWHRFDIIARKS